MAKEDKEYSLRMQGMIYAYNLAKKEGLESLESDIKKRNVLKAPMKFTEKQMHEFYGQLSQNLYTNMLTSVAWVLHDQYRFGKKRMQEFKKKYDKAVENTLDLDWLGQHYIKLEDYATELNEKFDLGIDVTVTAVFQDVQDESSDRYRMVHIDRLIERLIDKGFNDAAKWLQSRKL